MIKTCFCAIAMMLGALIGANAPAEWRGNAPGIAIAAGVASIDIATAYRPD
jgi:hypothetical protein